MNKMISQMGQGEDRICSLVAWDLTGVLMSRRSLVDAMDAAGLDSSIVEFKKPSQVFMQAARQAHVDCVVDKLYEDDTEIKYQLTRRYREDNEVVYVRETFVYLGKHKGVVCCPDEPALAEMIEKFIDEGMDRFVGAHITSYLKQLVKACHVDIFPLPGGGTTYLIPVTFDDFVANIHGFVESIGGMMNCIPINKGPSGEKMFANAITGQVDKKIARLRKIADSVDFDNDSDDAILMRKAEEFKAVRYTVECYGGYLGKNVKILMDAIEEVNAKLIRKSSEARARAKVKVMDETSVASERSECE